MENFLQHRRCMDVEPLRSAKQTHTGDQPDQSEIMVAMQMRYKNMVDPAPPDLVPGHLHLCTLAAINQVTFFQRLQDLRSGVPVKSRYGGIVT